MIVDIRLIGWECLLLETVFQYAQTLFVFLSGKVNQTEFVHDLSIVISNFIGLF
jgi:hypothetical protein